MNDTVCATLPLTRWQEERGTYHLVVLTGAEAEAIAMHAAISRLEFGRARGFGSVKVVAQIGETRWKTWRPRRTRCFWPDAGAKGLIGALGA